MKIRENLGSFVATQGRSASAPPTKTQVGKVFGVITTENTPTKALFDSNGGWSGVGTIFYMDYEQSKDIDTTTGLSKCRVAKPFYPYIKDYPLVGELVEIIDAPSPASQVGNSVSQKYYTGVINLWNNNQQNAPSGDSLGNTFTENTNTNNLLSFEGDRIYQGRKGNGIRFGSTVSFHTDLNEWSSVGTNGDPIMILSNGYSVNSGSSAPTVEQINKDLSSIYLTSTQKLPLQPGALIKNNTVTTILPKDYSSSQLIFSSNRITLNSSKDEILLFSKTNIELNSDNIVNINVGNRLHLNSPKILLGTAENIDSMPSEPLLLGNKTKELLRQLIKVLSELGTNLQSVVTPAPGSPLVGVNTAGAGLSASLKAIQDLLKTITSDNNFTT